MNATGHYPPLSRGFHQAHMAANTMDSQPYDRSIRDDRQCYSLSLYKKHHGGKVHEPQWEDETGRGWATPDIAHCFRILSELMASSPLGRTYERLGHLSLPVSRVATYSVTPVFVFLPARTRLGRRRAQTG